MPRAHRVREGEAGRAAQSSSRAESVRSRAVRATVLIAALVSVLGAVALAVHQLDRTAQPSALYTPAYEAFLATQGDDLPFDARVWGGVRTVKPSRAPDASPGLAFSGRELLAEVAIDADLAERPSPEAWAASGVRHLIAGAPDRAIADLERALLNRPDDPRILNDLAAAYLVRASEEGRPEDLVRAFDAARSARELDPHAPEPWFNEALALQGLFVPTAAEGAWRRFLDLDPRLPWARRARRHLEVLEAPHGDVAWRAARGRLLGDDDGSWAGASARAVARWPESVRELAEEDLLGSWAEAALAGDFDRAAGALDRAERLAQRLAAEHGEHLLAEGVATARRFTGTPTPGLAGLARAHAEFRRARSLYKEHREAEARPLFRAALRGFEAAGSPFAAWCGFYLAVSEYQRFRFEEALTALDGLESLSALRRSPSLAGRILWVRGLTHLAAGRPVDALEAYDTALSTFERARLPADRAAVHVLLAEAYDHVGDEAKAWRHLYQALDGSTHAADPWRRHTVLAQAAQAVGSRSPVLAILYLEELVSLAQRQQDPVGLAYALLERSAAHRAAGDPRRAAADLAAVDRLSSRIPGAVDRERLRAALARGEGGLVAPRDPARAVESFSRALEFHERAGARFELPELLLERARAHRAAGDLGGAEADLVEALAETERRQLSLSPVELDAEILDRGAALTRELAAVEVARARPDLALRYMDGHRESVFRWLGSVGRGGEEPQVPPQSPHPAVAFDTLDWIPPGTGVIEYAVLEDRLLFWSLHRRGFHQGEVEITEAALVGLVADLRTHLRVGGLRGGPPSEALELFDVLLKPALSAMPAVSRLFLVPDGPLHDLPFAALVNPATGRFLVEDFEHSTAPSVRRLVFAATGRPAGRTEEGLGPALVFASPGLQQGAGGALRLRPLPWADVEARRVAETVQGSRLLTGGAASREAFLAEAGSNPILHVASHAVAVPRAPLLSFLALGGGVGRPLRPVYAHEIASLPLEGVRLTVLSACGPEEDVGSGQLGLATAFVAAGVDTVVSALWPLDDRRASELFEHFYTALETGVSPATALRTAQLELLERVGAPAVGTWAAFRVTSTAL